MDNFRFIYKILKYLEASMDYSEPDYAPIKAEALGLSNERWLALIIMLLDNKCISGVEIRNHMRHGNTLVRFEPAITLKGLEYLQENSMMRKVVEVAKGGIRPSKTGRSFNTDLL